MDPRFESMLTESQYKRRGNDLKRERVIYRPPVDPLWPRLVRATRHQLSTLFLGLGEHLSEKPASTGTAPAAHTGD